MTVNEEETSEFTLWGGFRTLEKTYYLTVFAMVCFNIASRGLVDNTGIVSVYKFGYLHSYNGMDQSKVAFVELGIVIPAFISAVFMGVAVEKCGFRMTLVLTGCILLTLSQVLNVYTSWAACQEEACPSAFFAPVLGSLGMPVLQVVLLSSFPYMAIPQIYGVAIGFAFSIINTAYVLFTIILNIFLPYSTVDISSLTLLQILARDFTQ